MKLFWTDIETTGLDAQRDKILEIAVFEADLSDPFNAKMVYHRVLQHPPVTTGYHPDVIVMHEKTGLWDEAAKSLTTFEAVEHDLLTIVPEVEDYSDRPVVAGSSAHFDLGFIKKWMPKLAKRLSHRVFDVSTLKMLAISLGMEKLIKTEAHRAIEDVEESILHGKMAVDWIRGIKTQPVISE